MNHRSISYLGVSVPANVVASLRRWAEHGIPPGGFLQAVLRNDLREACARADEENRYALHAIVCYVYNELPAPCWGSAEAFEAWVKRHAEAKVPT